MANDRRVKAYVKLSTPLPGGENAVRVEVYHDKGGINYFTYKTEPAGFWCSTGVVELKDGAVIERLMMGGGGLGRRFFLAPVPRFNAKKLDALAERVLAEKDQIAALVVENKQDEIRTLLATAAAAVLGSVAA